MKTSLKNRKGFSLTELLVVIVILAILVSLALPRYISSIAAAKTETCRANIRAINSTVVAYQAKNKGNLPDAIGDLVGAGNFFDPALPVCPFGDAYALNADKNVDTAAHFGTGDYTTVADHE